MAEGKDIGVNEKPLRSDFGLFIPTHGRPNTQMTLDMMLDTGYTGDWWLVCDNLDESLDEYKSKYGDKIIVFDKHEWAERSDTLTNIEEMGTVLYARNFIQDKAKEMGYQIIGMFDDDLESFSIRYEKDGSLVQYPIVEGMDKLISSVVEYILEGRISAFSFAHNGGYFGGLEGSFKKGMDRNPIGSYFLNLSEDSLRHYYRGIVNEDFIYNMDMGRTGRMAFKLYDIMYMTPERGSNEGGHKGMYEEQTDYLHSSYVQIASPNTLRMRRDGKSRTNWNATHARIVSSKWRKTDD